MVDDFAETLHKFSRLTVQERVQQKILAKELSALADWKVLIKNYFEAHKLALKNLK